MDENKRTVNSASTELMDSSGSPRSSVQAVPIALSPQEWQMVCRVLQHTSEGMAGTDVGSRIMGDRLFTIEDCIATQLASHEGDRQLD